jgi:hypothetical protein
LTLPGQELTLFGVKRDSVVFHMDIPLHINPAAGDDASEVVGMPLSEVESLDMFIDHKGVLCAGEPFKRYRCELPIS